MQPGQSLLQYRLVEKIGEGGMGAVYRASDTKLGREVALKVLPAEVASDPERLERFQREARAVAALNHPHIVTLFTIENDGETHFLTMELVHGTTLDRMLTPGGLPLPQVFDISIALADALAAAHENGVVHRDLKPANVMIGAEGRVKVLDFGLAKLADGGAPAAPTDHEETAMATAPAIPDKALTQAGTVMGTAPYMSPEQLAGSAVDHRTDIFALGVVIYEMAAGRRPFSGGNSAELVSSIMRDTPQTVTELRQDLPRHLGRIVSHCLEKRVTDRFQSALDIRNELRMLRKEIDSSVSSVSGVATSAASPISTPSQGMQPQSGGMAASVASIPTPSQGMQVPAVGTEVHPPASTPPTSTPPTSPPSGIEPGSTGRGALWGALGGAAVVIALVVAFWVGQRGKGDPQTGGEPAAQESAEAAAVTPAQAETTSLAVLPFADRSPEGDQEYFTDGLSEELMNALGRVADLRVAGRTSSFAFKGKDVPLTEIGERLGVANILEGSVRKSGDQIRVSVQLVKAADGFQLWSETYDRTMEDVFAVQDDIASSVAEALEVTLLGASTGGGGAKADAEAYDLVLQARFVMKSSTAESIARSKEILEQALEIAPSYAPIWAEMGLMHLKEASFVTKSSESSEIYKQARGALQKALDLDPNLAEAHSRMAYIRSNLEWDFAGAEQSTDLALAASPTNPVVVGNAALMYLTLGRLDESIALNEEQVARDPLDYIAYQNLSLGYLLAGRLEDAEATMRRGLKLEPDNPGNLLNLGLLELKDGRIEQGRASLQRFVELLGNDPNWALLVEATVSFYAGDSSEADALMLEYEQKYCDTQPTACAVFYALRNRADETFGWLEKAYEIRDPLLPDYRSDVDIARFSDDPRWKPFWRKVGFTID